MNASTKETTSIVAPNGSFAKNSAEESLNSTVQNFRTSCQVSDSLGSEINLLPPEWVITPLLGNKAPYRPNWQNENPLSRELIIADIKSGKAKGYGVRTGEISGGIVAIDFDGQSAWDKVMDFTSGKALPETISFTSGRPGREQRLYLIPEKYWSSIGTKKIKTGAIDDDGKPEQLELRWNGCQSVLPPSAHPVTGFYQWVNSPQDIEIAPAPMWVIEAMLKDPDPETSSPQNEKLTDIDWALSYLNALSPSRADAYDDWLAVGMALNSVDYSLLSEWDAWSSSSPKYKPGECEKKWKSFKNTGKTIGSLAHMAKEDGWQSPFKSSGRGFGGGFGGGGGKRTGNGGAGGSGNNGGNGGDGNLANLSLRDNILEILNQNQDQSRRNEAFIHLAQSTSVPVREIKELAASIETEVDLEESRSDRKAEIENLLKIGKYQLDLKDYLHPSVAEPLERVANWMGTTTAAMLTTLYPVIASLLCVGTQLELIKATDFYALPVVYSGVVSESGSGKSPAQKTIIKPLFALQDEAETDYREQLEEYQKELADWKRDKETDEPAPEAPTPREYYTTDATSEAIALIQSQQPNRGFLGWFDELPALFKSQGQYKNGRGADGEKILSGRDGTGFKVNRASGKRFVVSQSAYSIVGSLQPAVLRQMMGDFTDANGQWARFLWTVMQIQPAPYPDDAIPFDISRLLKGIYRRISTLTPTTYKLSPEAQKLYRNWYNELDKFKLSESRQGLRAVYSKMKGDTGVLALLLHCFNGCVVDGSTPTVEVSQQTMAAAIKLAKYHIGQVKLIHSEGDLANGDIASIHAKIIQLSENKGWLKAADVRDIDRKTKKQFTANDIRQHFRELAESGFGQIKGEGTRLAWSIHGENSNSGQTQDTFGELRTNSGQTQDKIKTLESIDIYPIQGMEKQTQDTQDTFELAASPHKTKHGDLQIQEDDLDFGVPSCPELCPELENQEAVGVPANEKTQDSCPENVLSCPELPDYDQFPHSNPRAVWGVKKDKAERIKREILRIASLDDYFDLRENSEYTREELNWVLKSMLTQNQRDRLKEVVENQS